MHIKKLPGTGFAETPERMADRINLCWCNKRFNLILFVFPGYGNSDCKIWSDGQ